MTDIIDHEFSCSSRILFITNIIHHGYYSSQVLYITNIIEEGFAGLYCRWTTCERILEAVCLGVAPTLDLQVRLVECSLKVVQCSLKVVECSLKVVECSLKLLNVP
jgi:hypothetical protein